MQKEIRFTGYSAVPSDYECSDGQLMQSFNLLNETGSMQPIFPPKKIRDTGSYICIAIHKAGSVDWMILYLQNRGQVCIASIDAISIPASIVSGFSRQPAVAILGNTITLSDGEKSAFILYSEKEGRHKYLGEKIPEISISFALSHKSLVDESYSGTVTVGVPDGFSNDDISKILSVFTQSKHPTVRPINTEKTDAFLSSLSDAVVGFLNKMTATSAEENKFIHPFLLRWALRLYDGSYIRQSAPILMVPNSGMPPLKYSVETDKPLLKLHLESIIRRCTLMIRPTGIAELSSWTDIVKSIDFFASLPIYTYDQSGTISGGQHRTDSDTSFIFSHSGVATPYVSTSGYSTEASSISGTSDSDSSYNNHRPGHSSSLSPDDCPLYSFADNGNIEAIARFGQPALLPPSFSREHIESGITSSHNFYLLASLPLTGEDAVADLPAFTPLDLNDVALSALSSRPTLPDDWRSHDVVNFNSSFPYNSRLALAGISSRIFSGFSLSDMGQYWDRAGIIFPEQCTVWVKLVRGFKEYWVSHTDHIKDDYPPRFLFYPDPSAVEMRIIYYDGSGWRLPLKSHDFLNGSYWFDGLAEERTPKEESVDIPVESIPLDTESTKIYLSEVNNPLFFPVENRISVGTGRVIGISSASKALSQGQFGQFPLYAFTDEGVWALEISSTGGFSAKQPVTRDVCINPDAITQIDSAVLFPTDRGVMLISGSQTQCISGILDSKSNFDINSLPGLHDLFPGVEHPDCTFRQFIANCRISYNYVNQRIIVFNPDKSYCYIYSLKSKLWGIQNSSMFSVVNSYPDAFAMARDGGVNKLVDISLSDERQVSCMLISRPIKFDSPDLLKTVPVTIQRGILPDNKEKISTLLYATRDYIRYHLVGSSRGRALRTFLGTPYKAFIVVSVATLDVNHHLVGCSFDVIPRMTNRLR